MQDPIIDRKRGCFYGLAIGDALGAAVEFRHPGEFAPVTGYRGFGPHGLDAGQWTDDTSMALALADSIAEKGWNIRDQLDRYLNWFRNGEYSVNGICFDIGGTTRNALYDFESNGTIIADSDLSNSGNGSIMRLAPVPIKYHDHPDLQKYLSESSKTTHASVQCVDACIALGNILSALIHGDSKEESLCIKTNLNNDYCTLISNIIKNRSYISEQNIVGSGWVVKSLEAALWAFYHSSSFEECVLKAVNLGNDSDTTGAIAGQLAGALYGFNGIPQHLIDGLDKKDVIEKYLEPIL